MKSIICNLSGIAHIATDQAFRRDIALHYEWEIEEVNSAWSKTRGAYLIGQLNEDTFWNNFLDCLEIDRPYELVIPELKQKFRLFISRNTNFFKALDAIKEVYKESNEKPRFFVASNNGKETSKFLMEELELKEHFEGAVFSHEIQVIQPNPEFYEKAVKVLKIKPEESLFVDIKQENIDAAAKAGFKNLLYKDADSFQKKVMEFLSK